MRVVAGEQVSRAPTIAAGAVRRGDEFGDGGGVAQAEIEPLRADRRHDVGGFADQRDRGVPRTRAPFRPQAGNAAAGFDAHPAKQRMRAALDLGRECGVARCGESRRVVGIEHANQARTSAGQGHERERAAFGVEFRRNVVVRARVCARLSVSAVCG